MSTVTPRSRYQRWRRRVVTPETVYGTLLVSSIIAVSEDTEPTWLVLVIVMLSASVFWVAHVFAGTIAHQGRDDERVIPIRHALRTSAGHSVGLLYAAVPPIILLVIGMIAGLSPYSAQSLALSVTLLIFLVIGWQAMSERGARWYGRLLGSVVTLVLGIFVILLETLSH